MTAGIGPTIGVEAKEEKNGTNADRRFSFKSIQPQGAASKSRPGCWFLSARRTTPRLRICRGRCRCSSPRPAKRVDAPSSAQDRLEFPLAADRFRRVNLFADEPGPHGKARGLLWLLTGLIYGAWRTAFFTRRLQFARIETDGEGTADF
jgi:hypothetical protein